MALKPLADGAFTTGFTGFWNPQTPLVRAEIMQFFVKLADERILLVDTAQLAEADLRLGKGMTADIVFGTAACGRVRIRAYSAKGGTRGELVFIVPIKSQVFARIKRPDGYMGPLNPYMECYYTFPGIWGTPVESWEESAEVISEADSATWLFLNTAVQLLREFGPNLLVYKGHAFEKP
jgi:hypothetical protein